MEDAYEAVVIGAGVGGLSAASILAREGMRVLVLEQNDRVGGRALSIRGEEISDRGAEWYRALLATQYTRVAGSSPALDEIVRNRVLDGYSLDVGYHAISANGVGYMLDFEELVGGLEGVVKHGGHWASYYKGGVYRDVAGKYVDPVLRDLAAREGIPYLDFYREPHTLTEEEIDALEGVSLMEWAESKGITGNDVIFDHIRTVSTLFSTINDPTDISIGDIFRYFKNAFGSKTARGLTGYNGGFVEGGVMEWSRAVRRRLESLGGEVRLERRVKKVLIEDGKVTGVTAVTAGGGTETYRTGRVISNIPAQQSFGVLPEEAFPEEWVRKVKGMYGYGSYTPYMGLSGLAMPEEHAKLGLKSTCILPREEGFDYDVYICWNVQSAVDPFVAPPGKHLLAAYLPLTEKESLDRTLVDKLIRRLPDFLEDIYPGFKASVEWRLDLVCWKLEGVAKSISQAGTKKLPVKSPHVEGLFFAGDTARGYGVAMDCAIASGMICASAVTGRDYGIK
jgi:phytoene dehydrogenase-like protein